MIRAFVTGSNTGMKSKVVVMFKGMTFEAPAAKDARAAAEVFLAKFRSHISDDEASELLPRLVQCFELA